MSVRVLIVIITIMFNLARELCRRIARLVVDVLVAVLFRVLPQDISDVMSLVITQDRDTKNGSGVTGQHDKDVQYVKKKNASKEEKEMGSICETSGTCSRF